MPPSLLALSIYLLSVYFASRSPIRSGRVSPSYSIASPWRGRAGRVLELRLAHSLALSLPVTPFLSSSSYCSSFFSLFRCSLQIITGPRSVLLRLDFLDVRIEDFEVFAYRKEGCTAIHSRES